MTWVIGASTMFGYGIVLSDICVTYGPPNNRKTANVLQKAYLLAPDIVGGFSGSVYIGFQMLYYLQKFLKLPEGHQDSHAWKPDWVAEQFSPIAKEIFEKCPKNEQKLGSEIIIVGAHPTEDVGIKGWARIYISVLKWPNFIPEVDKGGVISKSIGSGAKAYKDKITEVLKDPFPILQGEVSHPGGAGNFFKITISNELKKNPKIGISEHLHAFLIRRGGLLTGTNNCTTFQNGIETEFKMPDVARNYEKLLKKLNLASKPQGIIA